MSVPTAIFKIDVTNDPTSGTRSWTDISAFVRAGSWTRDGRSNETERTSPGSLSLTLDNRDGRFTSGGTLYPNLKTTRWVTVQGVWAGATIDRWSGLIDSLTGSWPGYGKDATTELQATTVLKALNLTPLDGLTYGTQFSGARVSAVLSDSRVAAGTIETGSAYLPVFAPAEGDGTKALGHLQDVEADEQGIIFSDGAGLVQFEARHHRFNATTVGTLGDAAGEIPYMDPSPGIDDQLLFNSAHRTTGPPLLNLSTTTPDWEPDPSYTVVTAVAYDSASGTAHYVRDDTRTLLTSDGLDARAAAQAFVLRYKEPARRVNSIQVLGAKTPANWPTILAAKNGDQFRFIRRYPGGGTVSDLVFLEQVSESVEPGRWDTTWMLSPGTVDAYMTQRFLRLDSATFGKLDTAAVGW